MNKINEQRAMKLMEKDYDHLTDEEYNEILSFIEKWVAKKEDKDDD